MLSLYVPDGSGLLPTKRDGLGFLMPAGALYLGPNLNTAVHSLHSYKIYIATHGEFDLHLAGGRRFSSCKAVVIAPDLEHRIVSHGIRLATFYLIPETAEGRRVSRFFPGREVFTPPPQALAAVMSDLHKYVEHGCQPEEAAAVSHYLFRNLTPPGEDDLPLDPRVKRALEFLDRSARARVTLSEISSELALSNSRLEHLFKQEVGIPIRRYVAWARIREALTLMTSNRSLTYVAHETGFSDLAHLSRTFRRMIGVPPSSVLQNIRLIRAG